MNIFQKSLLIFNLIFAALLVVSCLAPYISPQTSTLVAFAGVAYPAFLFVNLVFIIIWIFIRIKIALLFTIIVLAGIGNFFKFYQFSGKDAEKKSKLVKVMSYNVKNFGIYNYKKGWKYNYTDRNNIFNYLNKEKPAIICFQEYVYDCTGGFNTTDTIPRITGDRYNHSEFTVNSKNKNFFGIATFSKYPIVNKGKIDFPNSKTNLCIYTDIKINNQIIRVYNAHFESLHFAEKDYKSAENIKDVNDLKKNKREYLHLYKLISDGMIKRALQVNLVAESIKTCKYPVILCTDLNDTPVSYAYHMVSNNLTDAFKESGKGFMSTLSTLKSLIRIDYIFHSDNIKSYNFEVNKIPYSDHYPIKCYMKL